MKSNLLVLPFILFFTIGLKSQILETWEEYNSDTIQINNLSKELRKYIFERFEPSDNKYFKYFEKYFRIANFNERYSNDCMRAAIYYIDTSNNEFYYYPKISTKYGIFFIFNENLCYISRKELNLKIDHAFLYIFDKKDPKKYKELEFKFRDETSFWNSYEIYPYIENGNLYLLINGANKYFDYCALLLQWLPRARPSLYKYEDKSIICYLYEYDKNLKLLSTKKVDIETIKNNLLKKYGNKKIKY